jgi:hypothetical protein
MEKASLTDLIAWLAIALWLCGSAYMFAVANGDFFQRLGALGIVCGVIYYAVAPPPVVHPAGQIQSQLWRDKTSELVAHGNTVANENVSLLAASIQSLMERDGQSVPESIRAIARPAIDRITKGQPYPSLESRHSERETIAAAIVSADVEASRVERIRAVTQAALVVIGTIQSGFGSLLVSTS